MHNSHSIERVIAGLSAAVDLLESFSTMAYMLKPADGLVMKINWSILRPSVDRFA